MSIKIGNRRVFHYLIDDDTWLVEWINPVALFHTSWERFDIYTVLAVTTTKPVVFSTIILKSNNGHGSLDDIKEPRLVNKILDYNIRVGTETLESAAKRHKQLGKYNELNNS